MTHDFTPIALLLLLGLTSAPALARGVIDAGAVTARERGPTMMWTPDAPAAPAWLSSEVVARLHLERHRATYGLPRAVITEARLLHVHAPAQGGIIVALRPTVAGVDVLHADVKVLLDPQRRPLAITGNAHPAAHAASARSFVLDDAAAVTRALADRGLTPTDLGPAARRGGSTYFTTSVLRRPIRALAIYFPAGDAVLPAYFVELPLVHRGVSDLQQLVIAADDGRVLMRRSATDHATYKYRVWADVDGDHRPADGPQTDWSPHPTGLPDVGPDEAVAPALISMEGFNTNPDGLADPWLPPKATETRGNNVHAYIDHDNSDSLDGAEFHAEVTAPGVFDRTYDITQHPLASEAQSMAAITQLFYVTNWMHDYWYDSGFTEAAGNAQAFNYGRGGHENDALQAEAQDAADFGLGENAYMSVPLDGASPTLEMNLFSEQNGQVRDSSVDNMLAAHEWGHYLHRRLVVCGVPICLGQGEGWGDFNALLMALREGDDREAVYANLTYVGDTAGYFGFRRYPYSVDFTRDPLTYRHIADENPLPVGPPSAFKPFPNSQQHNTGEVWASMLWESYVDLHDAHPELSFDEVRRRMADHVVAGMMLAPEDPTMLEQRDALLMVAAARDMEDHAVLAAAFARRGAGSCAVSPDRHSVDYAGVQEDFEVRGRGLLHTVDVDDTVQSCDGDGVLDVGELGRLVVKVHNLGGGVLPAGSTVEVVDPDPDLVFPNGPAAQVSDLEPLASADVAIELALAPLAEVRPIAVTVRLTTPDGCVDSVEHVLPAVFNADLVQAAAAVDDVEADPSVWTVDGDDGDAVWRRASDDKGWYWHATNLASASDTRLVSPPLEVSADQPLTLQFDHRHSFETADSKYWDGAVLEIKREGSLWVDLATLAPTGYGGTIAEYNDVLAGRPAYVGVSADYPAFTTQVIELGDALAGEKIALRLRVAADGYGGAPGWDIDNIRIDGLAAAPFPAWQDDQCQPPDDGTDTDTGSPTGSEDTADDPTPTTAPTGADTTGEASDGPDETATGDDGCGCTQAPQRGPWALVGLLLLGLRRRRRP